MYNRSKREKERNISFNFNTNYRREKKLILSKILSFLELNYIFSANQEVIFGNIKF